MHFLVTVAVLVYAPTGGGAGTRRGEAERAIVEAERAYGATVIDGDVVAAAGRAHGDGWTAETELGFFARAAALVAEGRRALGRVELARGEAALAQAEALYAPELWRAGVGDEAAEAAKWRGVALFELGQRGEATRAWRRAAALEPATQLTEAMVRPDVARAFAEALRKRPLAPLTVVSDGIVFVDGRRPNAATLELPVGEHLVVARAPGMRPAAKLVDVPAAGVTATISLEADARAQAIAALRDEPGADGVEAARVALGADAIVVAAISVDAGALTWAATKRQAGCGSDTVTETRADELVRRLDASGCRAQAPIAIFEAPAIAQPRPAAAGRSAGGRRDRPERATRLWERPWIWVGVVGALGVGVVLAVNLWPRDATYTGTVDYHQFSLGYSSTR
ncbi:MAG: hypothetical protein JWN44_2247 [Myxococcales bacterium]|nr:hypothetical protein [Myxococcales bacterium]